MSKLKDRIKLHSI